MDEEIPPGSRLLGQGWEMQGATLCQALLEWRRALGLSQALQSSHLPSEQIPKLAFPGCQRSFLLF